MDDKRPRNPNACTSHTNTIRHIRSLRKQIIKPTALAVGFIICFSLTLGYLNSLGSTERTSTLMAEGSGLMCDIRLRVQPPSTIIVERSVNHTGTGDGPPPVVGETVGGVPSPGKGCT